MTFWASGPTLGPPWSPLGPTLGIMDIQNRQISMQILTLQAKICLQTKFEANQAKNDILGFRAPSWAPPGAPWAYPGNHGYWISKIVKYRCRFLLCKLQ